MDTLPDQLYKTVLENSLDLVSIMREDGLIIYESPSVRDVLGFEQGELVGKNILTFIHPMDLPKVIGLIAQGKMNRGKRYSATVRFRLKDGSWRWIESVGKYMPDDSQVQGIFVHTRDVSALKQIEEEKATSEVRYQAIIAAMIEGVMILNKDGHILDCNDSACKILGLTRDQLMGRSPMDPLWSSIHEDGSIFPGTDHPTMQTLKTGKPVRDVIIGVNRADGSRIWTLVNSSPLTGSDGSSIGVVASFTDVSLRKNAEEKLRNFEHIIEQSPATIVVTDPTGAIEYVNPAFSVTTEYSREEAIGKNPRILKSGLTSPETYASLWSTVCAKKVWHGELCNKKKSGEIYWEFATISPICDAAGNIIKYSAIKENITERKRIEQRMVQSEDYLGNIINVAADPIFVKDRKHRWILLNDSMCTLVGRTREELIGHSDYDFFPKAEADVFWAKDEEVFVQGKENSNEDMFTDAKGDTHTIVTKKSLYTDKNGDMFIVGVIRDITKQKRIDEELKNRAIDLERINSVMVGRELRMIQLKEELEKSRIVIERLTEQLNGKNPAE